MEKTVVQTDGSPMQQVVEVRSAKPKMGIIVGVLIFLVIVGAGTLTGYLLANGKTAGGEDKITSSGDVQKVKSSTEVGVKDDRVFKDTTEGKLEKNDDKNITEGSHRLIRPGGKSQTVYLTSSVVDLNQFVGKCVQVWGETFAGQKAGWLMDVGRVKVIDSCSEE